jgi:hypothetical protein
MANWTAADVMRYKSSAWTAEDVMRLKEQPQKEEKPLTPGLKSFVDEKLETGKLMKTIQDPLASPRDKLEARIKLTPELPMIDTNKLEPPKPDRNLINMFDSSTTGGYLANKAISGMYGVAEGLEGFREIMSPDPLPGKTKKRLIDPELTARERAELAQVGEDKSGLVRFAGDVVEGVTGMLPTVALGAASGGTMGIPFVMQQSAGRGFTEALQEGADRGQARLYGAGSGLLEGGIEAVIGGIPGMKGVADPLVDSATQGIRSKILKEVAKRGLDALGEGAEEVLSTALDPLLKRATYDKDAQFASGSDLLRSFGTGAATSALLQAPSAIANIQGRKVGEKPLPTLQNVQNDTVEGLTDLQGKDSFLRQGAAQDPTLTATAETEAASKTKGKIPEGMKERGFSENIRTDQAMPDDIRQSFDENPETYKQIANKDTLAKAQDIFNRGQAAAEAEFYKSIGSKEFRPEDVPLAKLLAKQASEQGDTAKARQILSDTAAKLTEAGQFSQAAKILREADPETFIMTIDKQIKKLNEQGQKQYGKKWKDIDLTPSEIDAINKIERGNQQSYEDTWEQIGQRIAKELPSTGMEKFDAWRRMAMLLNPKTHIRNVVGNTIMMGMRKASDTIGAVLEKVFKVPEGQRTKSVGWSADQNIASKVNENWETVKNDILGESRWEIDNLKSLGMEKNIFKNPVLQGLNETSLKSLNWEDNIFTQRAYKDALGQYMKANKLDTVTDEAVAYAKRRALESTFKQANKLATWINEAKRVPVVGKLVEGAIPFTKTPANIISRSIEYSPAGIFKALYDVAAKKPPSTVIEDLAKGLTGSAITALGFMLASFGWAKVERNRSAKAEGLMQEMGDQTNSIITPLGSYTFDWAQPFAVPLAMGIAAQEAMSKRKDGGSLIEATFDGIASGGDTIFNMTMLQNVRKILGSGGSVTEKIMGIPISYVEQAIPSLFGQIARTIDPVRRSTYDPNPAKEELNRIKARLPGLSNSLEPALDIWGEEQKQGGLISQFLSPGYTKERSKDPVTIEVSRLYKSIKETDLLPKVAQNFSDKGNEYVLTAQERTLFQQEMGQKNYSDIQQLINSSGYKQADDQGKAKMIKRIVDYNYDLHKKKIINTRK